LRYGFPSKTEIGHQFAELFQSPQVFSLVLGEFHDQHRIGISANASLMTG
jgi:hypothetical protein